MLVLLCRPSAYPMLLIICTLSLAQVVLPASATLSYLYVAVISSRQVQCQLDGLQDEMRNLQAGLEEKFRQFRLNLDQLPSRPVSAATDRPPTRGSRRSRIMEAKAFATNQYAES